MPRAALAMSAVLLAAWTAAPASAQSVYGRDNRMDLHQLQAQGLRDLARGVVALFESHKVTVAGETAQLASKPLKDRWPMAPGERFVDQPSGADCSGFLAGPRLVVTAGHCLRSVRCEDMSFVFDFAIREPGQDPTKVAAASVYGCSRLVAQRDTADEDFAVVLLDREVKDRKPLDLEPRAMKAGERVFTIGHPFGLPAKYAGSAEVRGPNDFGFSADVDVLGGNSGGPVFSTESRKVVGLVSRSDPFLVPDAADPSLVRVNTLAHGQGVGSIIQDAGGLAGPLEAGRRDAVIGRGESERMQRRLERLVLELP